MVRSSSAPNRPTTSGASTSASQKLPVHATELVAGVGAQHVERAVGEVDHAQHAEHQRQARGEQEQQRADAEADQDQRQEVPGRTYLGQAGKRPSDGKVSVTFSISGRLRRHALDRLRPEADADGLVIAGAHLLRAEERVLVASSPRTQ